MSYASVDPLGFLPFSNGKKGVCLARCTGELHPGPSGWIQVNSEALDILTFRRAEQREGITFPLRRPPPLPLLNKNASPKTGTDILPTYFSTQT